MFRWIGLLLLALSPIASADRHALHAEPVNLELGIVDTAGDAVATESLWFHRIIDGRDGCEDPGEIEPRSSATPANPTVNEVVSVRLPPGTYLMFAVDAGSREGWRHCLEVSASSSDPVQQIRVVRIPRPVVTQSKQVDAPRRNPPTRLPPPSFTLSAVLPTLARVTFEPLRCDCGADCQCGYSVCSADDTATCLHTTEDQPTGETYVVVDADRRVELVARAVVFPTRNSHESSHFSTPRKLTTPPLPTSPPNPPLHLKAHALSPYSLRLDWRDGSIDEYGFELLACADQAASSCHRMALIDRDNESFVLHGNRPGTRQRLLLRAFNPAGLSADVAVAVTLPKDVDLDAAIQAWIAEHGDLDEDARRQSEVFVDALDDVNPPFPNMTERCTSRRELTNLADPAPILLRGATIAGIDVHVFAIHDEGGDCSAHACSEHAYADRSGCYQWVGKVVQVLSEASIPPRPALQFFGAETGEGATIMRPGSDEPADAFHICSGNDADVPATKIKPPYASDWGRLTPGCQYAAPILSED